MVVSAQPEFDFAAEITRRLNNVAIVEIVMSDGQWWTQERLIERLQHDHGVRMNLHALNARFSDLRKRGYTVERRPIRRGSRTYEYRASKP